jgi:hypothetical protein
MVGVCVFGDWEFRLTDEPHAVYRPGERTPLVWRDSGLITPALMSEAIVDTMQGVALAAHWHKAHPSLLEAIVGPVEKGLGLGPRQLP